MFRVQALSRAARVTPSLLRPASVLRSSFARSMSKAANDPRDPAVPGEYTDIDIRNTDRGILHSYPHVPLYHAQLRPQDMPEGLEWEDRQERRHFEEPLHEDDEILTVWAVDDQCENHITPNEALAQVVMALFGLFALYKTVVYCKGDMSMPPLAKKEMSDPCAERNYQQI